MTFKELGNVKIKEGYLNQFYFDKLGDGYLLTNDFGSYAFLSLEDFRSLLEGKLDEKADLYQDLRKKGFIRRDLSEYGPLVAQYQKCKGSLFSGPGLHIVVVTERCNQNCIYCQASAKGMKDSSLDMDKETAQKTVDRILEATSPVITIEFQGGEPLVNWEVVKFIVEYAKKEAKKIGKKARFSLVTNLSLMDEEKMDFLNREIIGVCTSLDGPREVHNRNRPYPKGDSYGETVKWIERYREKQNELQKEGRDKMRISSLVTISKISLDYPKEIVDEYMRLGFPGIHLRPLSYLGYSAGNFKQQMGYSMEDFMDFWRKALDYIMELNIEGNFFRERGVELMLKKILAKNDPGFTDLRSPCGAATGQMLYNHDGDVFTCDEGRMVEEDIFKIGNVFEDGYEEMINSDTTHAMMTASLLENEPCHNCVYKPYCGVCPVKNYEHCGTLFPQIKNTEWCKLHKGQFDYIFSKLKEEKYKKILEGWISSPK